MYLNADPINLFRPLMETITILGNTIHCFANIESLYAHMKASLSGSSFKGYVTVNNVHTMMEGFRHDRHRRIINEAYLSIPDGKPLEIVGRLKGNRTVSRLFGPTVMERFLDWGQEDGLRHFFIGSNNETLGRLTSAIKRNFPEAIVTGMISPPFAPEEQWPNEEYLRLINEARPDFIWVGFGAPKQERWMANNWEKLDKGIMIGIGAGFAYVAGETSHAPDWMKNASLEWMYRLIQEPGRLWKRYATTIPPFLLYAGMELLGWRFKK